MSAHLFLTCFMTCFGSSFLIGYYIGILNNPGDLVKDFVSTGALSLGLKVDANVLYALSNAVFVAAAAIGAFSCGWVADRFGRRNGVMINHIPAIIGSFLVGPCVKADSLTLFYLGRTFSGVNCGVSIGIASMFLTEIAPRKLRGAIGACHQLAVTLGIMVSYLMTMDWSLNTDTLWPVAYALGGVPALISLIVLPFCPESPRFLFRRNEIEAARAAFLKLNHNDDVDMFIGELQEEVEIAKQQPAFRFKQLFVQRDLRMPVILACLIQIMQQLSGINAVMAYSSSILNTAGVPKEYKQTCVLVIGIVNVVVTVISLPLLERLGRRVLLLWPTFGLAWILLFLVIFVNLQSGAQDPDFKKSMGIVATLLIFGYIICFALGLGPVPGLIVSEIFRTEPRASAYSLSQCIQWLSNLVVVITFPSIDKAIGGYSFLPFLIVVACCWVVFFLFMPETKNRTFDEVATDLAFGKIVVGQHRTVIESKPMDDIKGGNNSAQARREQDDQEVKVRLISDENHKVEV